MATSGRWEGDWLGQSWPWCEVCVQASSGEEGHGVTVSPGSNPPQQHSPSGGCLSLLEAPSACTAPGSTCPLPSHLHESKVARQAAGSPLWGRCRCWLKGNASTGTCRAVFSLGCRGSCLWPLTLPTELGCGWQCSPGFLGVSRVQI